MLSPKDWHGCFYKFIYFIIKMFLQWKPLHWTQLVRFNRTCILYALLKILLRRDFLLDYTVSWKLLARYPNMYVCVWYLYQLKYKYGYCLLLTVSSLHELVCFCAILPPQTLVFRSIEWRNRKFPCWHSHSPTSALSVAIWGNSSAWKNKTTEETGCFHMIEAAKEKLLPLGKEAVHTVI